MGLTIKKRNRKFKMLDSEVITILAIFHLKFYRNLKHLYLNRSNRIEINRVLVCFLEIF